jgi:hypothetical protein
MINPNELRKQTVRWYEDFLSSTVRGEAFFPREVRFGKVKASETLKGFKNIRQAIKELKDHSKESLGYGYVVEYVKRKDQKIGAQQFPQKIYFENERDYLQFIGKDIEYQEFKVTVNQITSAIPTLHEWISANPLKTIEHFGKWADLIKVCTYFLSNPKPHLYIRELPLELHTKFIEENKGIIRQLLDFLISELCNKGETQFEKRFNLKYDEPLIRLRILDVEIAKNCFSGLTDLSIPHKEFVSLNIDCATVFILENKTNFSNIYNFLVLPDMKNSIAIFGKGFQLNLLKDADWLRDKQIIYWGDIDLHGFQILSQLRAYFPQTRSLMMDFETFNTFREFCVDGAETSIERLSNLTAEENKLFGFLLDLKEKNRLEQEKITHAFSVGKIMKLTAIS